MILQVILFIIYIIKLIKHTLRLNIQNNEKLKKIKKLQKLITNIKHFYFKGGDDPADKITMQLVMGLYSKYKDNISKLTYQVILDELENLKYTGESRLIHYCFDLNGDRFHTV